MRRSLRPLQSPRAPRLLASLALSLSLGACGSPPGPRCHFDDGAALGVAHGEFDGVALLSLGGTLHALSADASGLRLWPLDALGAPDGPAISLGAGCDGGLASREHEGGAWIACLRRPDEAQDKPGALVLMHLDEAGAILEQQLVATPGRDSQGVDLEPDADGVIVAWHDGRPGAWAVWQRRIGPEGRQEPRLISSLRYPAGRPQLLRDGDRVLTTFAEIGLDSSGEILGEVRIHAGRGVPRRLVGISYEAPLPTLARDARGLLLAFRDVRRPYRKAALFILRLDSRLDPLGEPLRVGRSDGPGPPILHPSPAGLFAISSHTYRRDILVGATLLGDELQVLAAEQQVYAFGAHLVRAAARSDARGLLLLTAGRGDPLEPAAPLHTIRLRCE